MNEPPDGDPPPGGQNTTAENVSNVKTKSKKKLQYMDSDLGPFQVMIESVNVYKKSESDNRNSVNKKSESSDNENDGKSTYECSE